MTLPPTRPISPSPGAQLALEDIVGRDDDVARIWRAVTGSTSSILITAPRRIGKTRTMDLLCDRRPDGWYATIYSLQGVDSLIGLAEALLSMLDRHKALRTKVWDLVTPFLRQGPTVAHGDLSITLAAPFRDDPIAAVTRILAAVDERMGDDRLLLVCDELPDMVEAIRRTEGDAAARRALSLFRSWRDTSGEPGRPSAVRWLVTGSVGLHHVLRAIDDRQDLANDLYPMPLGPLDRSWAGWLAESLLLGAGISHPDPAAVALLADRSDGFAMVLHLVAAQVRDHQLASFGSGDVERLIDDVFRGLDASSQLAAFLHRVPKNFGPDTALAERLLDRLITGPARRADLLVDGPDEPVARDEDHLRTVLDWLLLDHYLVHDDSGPERTYAWRYPVLGRLWREQRR
ncbi:MAG TPA: hypothetical protein VK507_16610 [Iamia sp.]|nr:hypothetical protein [Iamia sp.]